MLQFCFSQFGSWIGLFEYNHNVIALIPKEWDRLYELIHQLLSMVLDRNERKMWIVTEDLLHGFSLFMQVTPYLKTRLWHCYCCWYTPTVDFILSSILFNIVCWYMHLKRHGLHNRALKIFGLMQIVQMILTKFTVMSPLRWSWLDVHLNMGCNCSTTLSS